MSRRLQAGVLMGALAFAASPAGAADDAWREVHRDDALRVESAAAREGAMRMRATREVVGSLAALRAVLLDLEGFPRWVEGLHRWQVLERTPASALVYGRHALPWPIPDRDYVVRYTWSDAGSRFVLDAQGLPEHPAAGAPGAKPIAWLHTRWELEPVDSGRTRVRYTYEGDIGSPVPRSVVEWNWRRRAPDVFERLSEAVADSGAAERAR